MIQTVQHGSDARESLKKGIDILANAVKATLGPKGRNVIINRGVGDPIITKDGVTVAKSIEVEDPIQNTGTRIIKGVALKTMEIAGDGTTTATVLAQAIMDAGFEAVKAGANPMELKRGIDYAVEAVVANLKEQSIDIGTGIEKLMQVALVSTNNDKDIASMIANSMLKMGKTGIINVEDSSNAITSISISKGLVIEQGLVHPVFTTNTAKTKGEYENCLILIYDKKISTGKSLVPVLEYAAQSGMPLFIMAEDFEMGALNVLGKNIVEGEFKYGAIKLPYSGDLRSSVLDDLEIATGAKIVREGYTKLENVVDDTFLGFAKKIISDKEKTTIIGGGGNEVDIKARIESIKEALKNSHSDYEKETLKDRIAKLTNGVATMYVGNTTEVEMNEKKDRIDDAIHAVKAAMQEGIVPGGGLAYIRAMNSVIELVTSGKYSNEEVIGMYIIHAVLGQPLKQICENAGIKPYDVINAIEAGKGDFGYNARTDKYEKLFDAGIVDPTMVARVALENAASIAGLLLTTEALVMNIK